MGWQERSKRSRTEKAAPQERASLTLEVILGAEGRPNGRDDTYVFELRELQAQLTAEQMEALARLQTITAHTMIGGVLVAVLLNAQVEGVVPGDAPAEPAPVFRIH